MIKDGFRGGVDGAVRGWPLKKEGVCWGGGAWGGVRGEAEVLQQECSVRATLDAHQVADDQVGKWGAILGVGKANDGAIQAIDDFKVRKKCYDEKHCFLLKISIFSRFRGRKRCGFFCAEYSRTLHN